MSQKNTVIWSYSLTQKYIFKPLWVWRCVHVAYLSPRVCIFAGVSIKHHVSCVHHFSFCKNKYKWLSRWTVKRCVWAELLLERFGFLTRCKSCLCTPMHLTRYRDMSPFCEVPHPVCGLRYRIGYLLLWAWGQFMTSICSWICIPTMISRTARTATGGTGSVSLPNHIVLKQRLYE